MEFERNNDIWYLGIDGGGTKTAAVLADSSGHVVRSCTLPACNPIDLGLEKTEAILTEAIRKVCGDIPFEKISLFAGISGGTSMTEQNQTLLSRFFSDFGFACFTYDSDLKNAVAAELANGDGIVSVLGTGSITIAVQNGIERRFGGYGSLFDENINGFQIGRSGIVAALRAHDGSGEKTILTERLEEKAGRTLTESIGKLYEGGKKLIASYAPLVLRAAEEGDNVSLKIVENSIEQTMAILKTACSSFGGYPVTVHFTGGLSRNSFIREQLLQRLEEEKEINAVFSEKEPVDGALLLAKKLYEQKNADADKQISATVSEEKVRKVSDKKSAATEGINAESSRIGEMKTLDAVRLIIKANETAVHAVDAASESIAELVDACAARMAKGGRLIYVGCGTSGRLGVLDASECPPTFGVSPEQVTGIIAGGDQALRRAVEGFEDDEDAGRKALSACNCTALDTVIGISASGGAPFVTGALSEARKYGALTAAVSSNPDPLIGAQADISIIAETGAEVIMGSTRMKAGTAQKIILNTISTCVMIRLGYVYRNLMINLKPTNKKLRKRMIAIVSAITGEDEEKSTARLESSNWIIRNAVSDMHL